MINKNNEMKKTTTHRMKEEDEEIAIECNTHEPKKV